MRLALPIRYFWLLISRRLMYICTFTGTSTNFSNVTMLSATSLLHNSMIFNRNNTVATQQGMKTYWLWWLNCSRAISQVLKILFFWHFSRSYRLSACRARCITAQGRIMSTTGVHNHQPHIKNNNTKSEMDNVNGNMQGYSQTNQNMQAVPAVQGMMNQNQQMCNNMNFNNNNFSMLNILTPQITDLEANSTISQASSLNQMESNIHITPIMNQPQVDSLQMQQQQLQRNILNMNVDIAITSNDT